jgi:hypothetical protein
MPIRGAVRGSSGDGTGDNQYYQRVFEIVGTPIVYFPLWEASGVVAEDASGNSRDGAYPSDVSGWPVVTGIGDGNTAPAFDGTNDYVDVYSAGLGGAFDGAEGTVSIWARISDPNVWTDGVARYAFRLYADGANQIDIRKQTTNNTLRWRYEAGGTAELVELAALTTTTWMHLAIIWSSSQDKVRAFYNGTQTSTDQTGLGTWAGSLDSNVSIVGAGSKTPNNAWAGLLAHFLVLDYAATPSQIEALAVV